MEPARYFLSREDTETKGIPAWDAVKLTQAEKKSDGVLRLNLRSSTSSFPSRAIVACLAVLLWGANVEAQDEVATLLNLSPWQSYVHLFCDKTGGADCAVTFRCGQQTGDPVTWNVAVEPSRIFTYWPNKTDGAGRAADLEAALVNAGLTYTEARRRATCTVRSDDPVKARAYTFLAGQLVPVANVNTVQSGGPRQPEPANVALSDLDLLRSDNLSPATLVPPFNSDTTSYTATVPYDVTAVTVVATATNRDAVHVDGIVGFVTVNGSPALSGVPSGPIQLTAGQTTTISITLTGSGASTRTYRIAVTRQEDTRTPPPGPNTRRGTISFNIADICNDQRRVEYRFFESANSRLTGNQWPAGNRIYYTRGFNEEGVSRLACTVGTSVCYGAEIDGRDWYWGVGLEGNSGCTDCCYTCTATPETVRLRFGCPRQ